MDTYLSNNQNRANNFGSPPILIVADTESAAARGRATAMMAGLRVADSVGIDDASARIAQQGAASALWIELDEPGGTGTEALLDFVAAEVAHGRYGAVIAVQADGLARVEAHALDMNIDVVVEATEPDRIAALALAASGARAPNAIHEATADKNAARLRQLSDEVSRIAATLARLSTGPGATTRPTEPTTGDDTPEVSIETVRSVIRARRLRNRFFPDDLFADPAWDMLLDLLQSEISNHRVPVSSLCIAAAVPATTALRWLKSMVQAGFFVRREDPHDGRRVFVELAPQTSQALRRYFAEVRDVGVI